ncbi:MAG TPA: site-2 protease family protein [Candidatus Acidoferrales bacterium]|nr:site-2 protease family protein [Candidatus Acidoferrales bacterium]
MLLGDPFVFLISTLFLVPGTLVAIPVHELGHALAAHLQGDRQPAAFLRRWDFKSFFEPYGVLAALLARVGWGGRSLPVSESRLRGAGGQIGYALGGPLANLAVAVVFGVAVRVLLAMGAFPAPVSLQQPVLGFVSTVCYALFFLNLSFFAFNLLPIPGLDGWRILEALLRHRYPKFFFDAHMRRRDVWTVAVLVVIVGSFFAGNLLAVVMLPIYAPASSLILGTCAGYPGLTPCPLSGR